MSLLLHHHIHTCLTLLLNVYLPLHHHNYQYIHTSPTLPGVIHNVYRKLISPYVRNDCILTVNLLLHRHTCPTTNYDCHTCTTSCTTVTSHVPHRHNPIHTFLTTTAPFTPALPPPLCPQLPHITFKSTPALLSPTHPHLLNHRHLIHTCATINHDMHICPTTTISASVSLSSQNAHLPLPHHLYHIFRTLKHSHLSHCHLHHHTNTCLATVTSTTPVPTSHPHLLYAFLRHHHHHSCSSTTNTITTLSPLSPPLHQSHHHSPTPALLLLPSHYTTVPARHLHHHTRYTDARVTLSPSSPPPPYLPRHHHHY